MIAVAIGVFAGIPAAVVGGRGCRGRRASPGRSRPRSSPGRLRLPPPEAAPRRRDRAAPAGTEPPGGRPSPRRGRPAGAAGHDRGRRSGGGRGPPRPRGRPRPGDRTGAGAARRPRRQGAGRDAADPARCGGPDDRAEDRGPRGARARSPRSRAPASGSRSRSATRRAPWSGPATTRPPPAPASSRTRWTPSRSPARPSASPRGARSWPPSSAASAIYQKSLDAIGRAETATMRTATRYLEKRMRGDMARLTGGRYRRVAVDDATLDISVFAPERGDWVAIEDLSQGTLDLGYLAARLGIVRLVTQDRRPPLIFDDPFVTFDDARAERAIAMLRDLAADFQVIYLTTSDRYDHAADRVVELPGPTAGDDGRRTRSRGRAAGRLTPAAVARDRARRPPRGRRRPPRGRVLGRRGLRRRDRRRSACRSWSSCWAASSSGWSAPRRSDDPARRAASRAVRRRVGHGRRALRGGRPGRSLPRARGRADGDRRPDHRGPHRRDPGRHRHRDGRRCPGRSAWPGSASPSLAIVLVSLADDGTTGRGGLLLALGAGVGFGLYSACVGQVEEGVFGPIVVSRATASALVLAIVAARRTPVRAIASAEPRLLRLVVVVGVLDLVGNAMFLAGGPGVRPGPGRRARVALPGLHRDPGGGRPARADRASPCRRDRRRRRWPPS